MPRPIAEIVADLVDSNACEFDHHGGCQMHGHLEPGEVCPQAEAKQWLAEQGEPRTGDTYVFTVGVENDSPDIRTAMVDAFRRIAPAFMFDGRASLTLNGDGLND